MSSRRLHNAIFALLIALVLGATAWSAAAREPGLFGLSARLSRTPSPIPHPPGERAKIEEGKSAEETKKGDKAKGATEQMIRRGELSRHPARYWRKFSQ